MICMIVSKDSLQTRQYINVISAKHHISSDEIIHLDYLLNPNVDSHIDQIDLFSNTKMFVIANSAFLTSADEFKQHKTLFDALKTYVKSDLLVYFVLDKKPLSNAEFINLTKDWSIQTLKEIDNNEKMKIINELLKNKNLFLPKEIYNQLLLNLDCNYGNIANEIDKLANLLPSNPSKDEMIASICNYTKENIFHLFEAILNKNHVRIWQIYNDLMDHHEDEISLINTLASQCYNLYYVLRLLKQACPVATISQLTGVSIYFINLYKTRFINYNILNINDFMLALYNLEVDIKLSKVDKNIGFKQFLLNISH